MRKLSSQLEDDYFIYLVENNPKTYKETMMFPDAVF